MNIFDKTYIRNSLDQLINKSKLNIYLNDCNKNVKIEPYVPLVPPDFTVKSCLNDMNKSYSPNEVSSDWFISAISNSDVSYVHFKLSENKDEKMLYIVKTCTDVPIRNRGISKILHYLVLELGKQLDIDYVGAYVTDKIEHHILQSFDFIFLDEVEIEAAQQLKSEIYNLHGVQVNSLLLMEEFKSNIGTDVKNCLRPY